MKNLMQKEWFDIFPQQDRKLVNTFSLQAKEETRLEKAKTNCFDLSSA